MPGMLTAADFLCAQAASGASFDRLFVALMTRAPSPWPTRPCATPGDPRLKVMAHAIRHGQRGEITLIHGIPPGFAVSRAAWHTMFAPVGEGTQLGH